MKQNINSQQFNKSQQKQKKDSLVFAVIVSVFVAATIFGGGVYWWQKSILNIKKEQMQQQINNLEKQTPNIKDNENADGIAPISNEYGKFKNDGFGIEFYYSKEWGPISVVHFCTDNDGCTGYGSSFTFNEEVGGGDVIYGRITAGGRSKDFEAYRSSVITDYSGFSGRSSSEVCAGFNATTCSEISKKVVSMVVAPKFDDICPPGPGGSYAISKVVAIDMPDNQKISGLVFEYVFLSNELGKELSGLLGTDSEKCYTPDSTTQKDYDNKVKEVLEKMSTKNLDKQTLKNIERFDDFVNSIKFYK